MDCMNDNRMDGLRLFIALTAVGSIEDHPRFKRLAEMEEAALHPCRHKKKVARLEGDDFFAHLKATPARNHHIAFIAAVRLLAILRMRDVELDLQLAADFADMEACAIRAGDVGPRRVSVVEKHPWR